MYDAPPLTKSSIGTKIPIQTKANSPASSLIFSSPGVWFFLVLLLVLLCLVLLWFGGFTEEAARVLTLLARPDRFEGSFEKLVILQPTEANRVVNPSNRRKRSQQSAGLVDSVPRGIVSPFSGTLAISTSEVTPLVKLKTESNFGQRWGKLSEFSLCWLR
jgi:hypothetical protein